MTEDYVAGQERIGMCEFCSIADEGGTLAFQEMYGLVDRLDILGVPESLVVLHDLCPLGERAAHVLTLPKTHALSLSMFDAGQDLQVALSQIGVVLRQMGFKNEILVFEHGSGLVSQMPVSCGGCNIEHAHGHVVALPGSFGFEDIKRVVEGELSRNSWNLSTQRHEDQELWRAGMREFVGDKPYLHMGGISREGFMRSVTYRQDSIDQKLESQLIRRVLAGFLGFRDVTWWNFRDFKMFRPQERVLDLKQQIWQFRLDLPSLRSD